MKSFLRRAMDRENLTQTQMAEAFDLIMDGKTTPAQIAAFVVALRMKGETADEIAGAALSMRRHAVFVDAGLLPVVDTCGTGGDGVRTFNISTAAALVVAGAGVPVAKHGNRAITSQCGSADLLAELGVNLEAGTETIEDCIREAGIGFLFAPRLHPAMKHAMGPRKEIGVRTIFNMLGPLTNPAGARAQLLGVFAPELTEPFAEVLRILGSRRAFVVHGHDGMDEITTTTTTRVSELCDGRVRTYELDPLPFVGRFANPADLAGGEPARNAAIVRAIFAGERGAPRDIVCLNAAAAIVAGGKAPDLATGWTLANESIASGQATRALESLIAVSRRGAEDAA